MLRTLLAAAVVALSASGAMAATIFSADTATTTSAQENSSFGYTNELINQDGFSTPFISGVTDFDSFVTTTTHTGPFSTFGSFAPPFPVNLDFGFNQVLTLERFALWNQSGSASVTGFDLFSSASGAFDDLVFLGSYAPVSGYDGQSFSFAATDVLGIRMSITSNAGATTTVRLTEVAFGGTAAPVPVPAGILLIGGALGLLLTQRKRAF
jgi:hypothetical protein